MNKKLRLVVTAKCPNKCPLCCNNRFDLNNIPIFDRVNYEEISITGGELMLFPDEVSELCYFILKAAEFQGYKPKIWLYTSRINTKNFSSILSFADGVCFTPHSAADVASFKEVNDALLKGEWCELENFSLRLNLFTEQEKLLEGEDLSLWKVKHMEWIKDCPVPEGEDFRRIARLL